MSDLNKYTRVPESDVEFQNVDAGWTDQEEDLVPCGLVHKQSAELEGHSPAYD